MKAWRWVCITAWSAIILGAALRFVQLPTRVLFVDEAVTEMRVAGHTYREMNAALFDGRQRTAGSLLQFARVGPGSTVGKLVRSLETEDAQHPPLFYVAEYAAVRALGDSTTAWRLLATLFGVACIPAAFLLARDLFEDAAAGLLAAALTAVSPIARIYSEQAREYSLLALLTLLSTDAVVRASRRNRPRDWLVYAVLAAAALYASPLAAPLLAAHGIFVLATSLRRTPRVAASYLVSVGAATVAYAPWLYQLVVHRDGIANENVWTATPWSFGQLAAKWVFNAGATFFDLEYLNLRWTVAFAVIAATAAYAVWRGAREAAPGPRWCLGAAILLPMFVLIVPDVVLGEHRSAVARYALPILTLLPILVAWGVRGRPVAAMVLLTGGALACAVGSTHATWWDNDANGDDPPIAAAIAAVTDAQVVSPIAPPDFIPIARLLPGGERISLSAHPATAQFETSDPLFVLEPTRRDLAALRSRTRLRFERTPYRHVTSAHDMASSIFGGRSNDAGGPLLYESAGTAVARR